MIFNPHVIVSIVLLVIVFALFHVLLNVPVARRPKRREQEKPAEDSRQDIMK